MELTFTDLKTLLNILVLLALATYSVQSYIAYRRLAHIPGPWIAGWSSLWLVGTVWRKKAHKEFYDITEKYGSVARIGPNVVVTSNIELLRRIGAARSPYVRSDWYLAFRLGPGADNVFSMLDEKAHTRRRAQMTNGYLGKENITIEPTIDRHILQLLDLIRKKYVVSGHQGEIRSMDLAEKAQFFTLDTIMDIATGVPVGDIEHDKDIYNYLAITASALPPLIMIGSVPSVANFFQLPFIAKKLYPTAEDNLGFGRLIGITQEKVAERFAAKDPVERQDMLQSFIRHGLSQQEAVSESLIQILGGSDTTAGAIRMIMLHAMTNQRVYSRLQAEIDTAFKEGKLSRPVVDNEESLALPYLQAVIKESLRIFPPGTGLGSKIVPEGGDYADGIFLPEGTKVGICMWGVVRNKEVFGQDADVFRPERWLDISPEQAMKMAQVQDFVFGYGKYVCLGRRIALIELNKVIVELLLNFEWSLVDPLKPIRADCYGLFVMSDMWVTITEREVKR